MDLRVSGKDLIQNHLTMSLYNHAAVWGGARADRMPQSFFCNGHVQVDGEKMAKSKGNFLMLHECVAAWSADATRFALADSGDSLEDANFERTRADAAILKLTTEEEHMKETLAEAAAGRLRGCAGGAPGEVVAALARGSGAELVAALAAEEAAGALTYADRVFLSQVNRCVREAGDNYAAMKFREALKFGFFELQLARDAYRDMCEKMGQALHAGVMLRFFEAQVVMLAPICPHWAEHCWGSEQVLALRARRGGVSVTRAPWPARGREDEALLRAAAYLLHQVHCFRVSITKATTVKASKAARGVVAQPKPTDAHVFVASAWPKWQKKPLAFLSSVWDPVAHAATGGFPADALKEVQKMASTDAELKPFMKKIMPLASTTMQDMAGRAERTPTLAMQLPFDEFETFQLNLEYVRRALELPGAVRVFRTDDAAAPLGKDDDPTGKAKDVLPLEPDIWAFAKE
jgi:leucyl-tRNA synthetase